MNHSFLQAESLSPSSRLLVSPAMPQLEDGDRSCSQPYPLGLYRHHFNFRNDCLIRHSPIQNPKSKIQNGTEPPPEREPIRHLLIGSPAAVGLTIHHLHILHYADAGLWSPAIALSSEQLILTLHPGEVMRVLVRYLQV
jgi:hypothetical protein